MMVRGVKPPQVSVLSATNNSAAIGSVTNGIRPRTPAASSGNMPRNEARGNKESTPSPFSIPILGANQLGLLRRQLDHPNAVERLFMMLCNARRALQLAVDAHKTEAMEQAQLAGLIRLRRFGQEVDVVHSVSALNVERRERGTRKLLNDASRSSAAPAISKEGSHSLYFSEA